MRFWSMDQTRAHLPRDVVRYYMANGVKSLDEHVFSHPFISRCLSDCLSLYLPVCLSLALSLSVFVSVSLSIYLSLLSLSLSVLCCHFARPRGLQRFEDKDGNPLPKYIPKELSPLTRHTPPGCFPTVS